MIALAFDMADEARQTLAAECLRRKEVLAFQYRRTSERVDHEIFSGWEVVRDQAGAHAEPVGDGAQGDPFETLVESDRRGVREDLLASLLGTLAGS